LQKPSSKKLSYKINIAKESRFEFKHALFIFAFKKLLCILSEELLKTVLAILEQKFSKLTILNILICSL
jgi:hypothetical protein